MNQKSKITFLSTLAICLSFGSVQAATIAVIDSGTDLNHQDLTQKRWVNPKDVDDAVDNDNNSYIDDVHGWNFADSNNKLIEKKFLGTFSNDAYKFFDVQTRMLQGTATAEDLEWMQQARSNQALLSELQTFGNFIHGTHVAGIAARGADQAKVMVLKIIPTKAIGSRSIRTQVETSPALREQFQRAKDGKLLKLALKFLASQQGKTLQPIGQYVGKKGAQVANCSFGTSTTAAKMILTPILKLALRRDPTAEEVTEYSKFFVGEVLKAAKALVAPAPKTLFVMAAGNDGTNNDELPTSPANLKLANTITVAATFGYQKLASFSNYGVTMVDVAAPGVGILSAVPGNQYLTVSGTSQAAPFVANLVGQMLDQNPALSHADLKAILMQTSDLKDFLKEKVASGGIVNSARAMLAAKLSLNMPIAEAVASSRMQISDVVETSSSVQNANPGMVLPLPSMLF